MENLAHKKCVPCEGGTKPFSLNEAKKYAEQVPSWKLFSDHLEKSFEFKDFQEAMNFVSKVAQIAEDEGHHPDIFIFYNKVDLKLSTHAIRGLSVNDFILAFKIDHFIN